MANSKNSPTASESKASAEGNVPSGDVTPVIAVNGEEPNTDAPKEVVPASVEEIPKMAELTGIRYIGFADVKSFTAADLEAMSGEEAKQDLSWSADNGFLVPTKEFNASTRDALLRLTDFTAE